MTLKEELFWIGTILNPKWFFSNIAMIHFYNHDYKKSLSLLEQTMEEFKSFKNSSLVLTEYQQAIYLKLLVLSSFDLTR